MDDTISRQAAIDKINERQRKLIYCFGFENDMVKIMDIAKSIVIAIPSTRSEIIRCKDCRKHNISPKSQEDYCPLYFYRGMSFGSEHDLQFCSYAERKTDDADVNT